MGAGKDEGGKGDGDRLERASDILLRRQRGVVMVRCTSLMLSWAIVRKRGRRSYPEDWHRESPRINASSINRTFIKVVVRRSWNKHKKVEIETPHRSDP